ncbi:uncharacterized protein LOC128396216 [Panonychus citri]|uniref:uncharacterized protein LOC128396216 n=1 Tax=Panonychus citri TaxID=50023 RepID=UPI002307C802|nr:uncharacterized protein LOC128396216 [Panonychus citri]
MLNLYKCSSIFILLIVCLSINVGQSAESGNWLTKSLDYYSLEKCSSLDKSTITGDFYGCLNSPSTGSKSPSSDQNDLGSGGWGGYGSNGVSGRVKRGAGNFGSSSFFSGQSGFGTSKKSQSKSSSDSGQLSLANDLQHIINCFPKLIKPCMIASEIQFFNTIKDFFQAQLSYVNNASLIATKIDSSKCVKSNSIDTSTICYSTNIHKQNWFGWKINWFDGQMCHFIDDISKCEISSFDKCPSDVKLFVNGLWDAGLKVTPCFNQTNEKKTTQSSTTLSSPPPATNGPVDQTKSLAPGSSAKQMSPNRLPVHLTNVTNINSNDQQSLNDMNNLTVDKDSEKSIILKTRENNSRPRSLVPERSRHSIPEKMNENDALDGFFKDQQPDSTRNNENNDDFDDRFTTGTKTNDFRGKMKHSKRVRLHEVDGEGESRHNHNDNHIDIEEEQWSRIKEEFRRKMRESIESQESEEDEYEEESEESDEDKDFEFLESRINPSVIRQNNEENDYRDNRNNRKNIRDFDSIYKNEQRKRSELEKEHQRKLEEAESRRRKERQEEMRRREFEMETMKQRNEIEARKREAEQRRADEEQRMREEIARNLERERQEEERRWKDQKKILRPESWIFPDNDWANNERNHQMNENEQSHHPDESSLEDCFESPASTWLSLNDKSANVMDLMCRKMESIKTCLDKHSAINRLDHFRVMQKSFCDENNKFKDTKSIANVMKCLADNSSSGQVLQTRYPNRSPSKFWNY